MSQTAQGEREQGDGVPVVELGSGRQHQMTVDGGPAQHALNAFAANQQISDFTHNFGPRRLRQNTDRYIVVREDVFERQKQVGKICPRQRGVFDVGEATVIGELAEPDDRAAVGPRERALLAGKLGADRK